MKMVCVIPARYQSTRFPGKPLADICGKPMIWWVYQRCKKVPEFSKVIVATDDERIAKVCAELKMQFEMTSDSHLTGTDRVAEVAKKVPADLYINVQGDEPLVSPETIRHVFLPFFDDNNSCEVTNLMTRIKNPIEAYNPSVVKVITRDDGNAIYLTRAPAPFPKGSVSYPLYKQLGIYCFTGDALHFFAEYGQKYGKSRIEKIEDIEMLRFIENGWNVLFSETDEPSVAVDTVSDLQKVTTLIKGKK